MQKKKAPKEKANNSTTAFIADGKDYTKECTLVAANVFNSLEVMSEKDFLQFAELRRIPSETFKEFFAVWAQKMIEMGFMSEVVPSVWPVKLWKRNK